VLLSCVATGLIFTLHPHLGVRDVDGYAYIMGPRSVHEGKGIGVSVANHLITGRQDIPYY
jgi:hypothetical protein